MIFPMIYDNANAQEKKTPKNGDFYIYSQSEKINFIIRKIVKIYIFSTFIISLIFIFSGRGASRLRPFFRV